MMALLAVRTGLVLVGPQQKMHLCSQAPRCCRCDCCLCRCCQHVQSGSDHSSSAASATQFCFPCYFGATEQAAVKGQLGPAAPCCTMLRRAVLCCAVRSVAWCAAHRIILTVLNGRNYPLRGGVRGRGPSGSSGATCTTTVWHEHNRGRDVGRGVNGAHMGHNSQAQAKQTWLLKDRVHAGRGCTFAQAVCLRKWPGRRAP
jgi:hypothetical protein